MDRSQRLAQKYGMQPTQPVQPTEPTPLRFSPQQKKKPNNMAMLAVVGGVVVVLIVAVFLVMNSGSPEPTPAAPASTVPSVNLPENQKREMYASLKSLQGMLKSVGTSYRSYKVLADRYHVSQGIVHEVEAEGNSKGWPKQ
jgi:hypothetical protein